MGFGVWEGPGFIPYYCNSAVVGELAVEPAALAAGDEHALFQLFVALSVFQGVRDTIVMARQRALDVREVEVVGCAPYVAKATSESPCPALTILDTFEQSCDVFKRDGHVDCERRPGARCHVKDATDAFNRMGDTGKVPTSAWRQVWRGGVAALLQDVVRAETSAHARAELLVDRFAAVHRVGRKLATMFVSALSTPSLAAGLTPWYPLIDGNCLVVVDTNVARAVDVLRQPGSPKTYAARERWLRIRPSGSIFAR